VCERERERKKNKKRVCFKSSITQFCLIRTTKLQSAKQASKPSSVEVMYLVTLIQTIYSWVGFLMGARQPFNGTFVKKSDEKYDLKK